MRAVTFVLVALVAMCPYADVPVRCDGGDGYTTLDAAPSLCFDGNGNLQPPPEHRCLTPWCAITKVRRTCCDQNGDGCRATTLYGRAPAQICFVPDPFCTQFEEPCWAPDGYCCDGCEEPEPEDEIFDDGFERGNTNAWSSTS